MQLLWVLAVQEVLAILPQGEPQVQILFFLLLLLMEVGAAAQQGPQRMVYLVGLVAALAEGELLVPVRHPKEVMVDLVSVVPLIMVLVAAVAHRLLGEVEHLLLAVLAALVLHQIFLVLQ